MEKEVDFAHAKAKFQERKGYMGIFESSHASVLDGYKDLRPTDLHLWH